MILIDKSVEVSNLLLSISLRPSKEDLDKSSFHQNKGKKLIKNIDKDRYSYM